MLIARPTSLLPSLSPKQQPIAAGNADVIPAGSNSTLAAHPISPDQVKPSQRLAAVGLGLVGVCGAAM